ncbi:MAG: hypothetical protein U9O86_00360 [Campylobacterota bacterium]|nr:hypothetical protein [Campylobacterota bacterium]
MTNKFQSALLLFSSSVIFLGCNSPKVIAAKQYKTKKEITKKLTFDEARVVYWLALGEINKSNNCIMSKHIFENNSRVAQCFSLTKSAITSKYVNLDESYSYQGMPTVRLEDINTTTDKYMSSFDLLSDEYLTLKNELIKRITNINYSKPKFESYQKLLSRSFNKPQDFYIKHEMVKDAKTKTFGFTTPYTLSNSNISNHFVLLKYNKPENIFFLYKKAQQKNPQLILDEFMLNNLKLAYIRQNININSKLAKYHFELSLKNLDEDELGYSLNEANIDKSILASLSNIKVDFLPASYSADDDVLHVEFVNEESENFIVSNKTNKFIQVNAISFYYDSEIITVEVNYKLPPTAVQEFSIDLKKIDDKYLSSKSIKVALALEYLDYSDKKVTIYETKNIYMDNIIK